MPFWPFTQCINLVLAYLGFSNLPLGLRQEKDIEDVPDLFTGCQSIISLLEKTAILRQEDVYCYMNRESLKLKPNITIWKTKSGYFSKSFGALMEMNYRPLSWSWWCRASRSTGAESGPLPCWSCLASWRSWASHIARTKDWCCEECQQGQTTGVWRCLLLWACFCWFWRSSGDPLSPLASLQAGPASHRIEAGAC